MPDSGKPLDPFDPGAFVVGVTSAFKRFFPPYCELQVLFTAEAGADIFLEEQQLQQVQKQGAAWRQQTDQGVEEVAVLPSSLRAELTPGVWETLRQLVRPHSLFRSVSTDEI
eukprot:COSAG02_NODE_4756_length_5022_cov_1.825107_4_plen_112_part_00